MSTYNTKSIPLASFLVFCLGESKLLSVTKPDGLCLFSFEDDGTCKELSNAFFSAEPTEDIVATKDLIFACSIIRRNVIEASAEARKQRTTHE